MPYHVTNLHVRLRESSRLREATAEDVVCMFPVCLRSMSMLFGGRRVRDYTPPIIERAVNGR